MDNKTAQITHDEPNEEESAFDLREILATLMRRWRMIAAVTVLFAVGAALYAMSLPNYYTATATVQIDKRDKKIIHIEGVLSDLKADAPTIESEVEVIASAAIAQRVVERLGLRDDPEFSSESLLSDITPKLAAGLDSTAPAEAKPVRTATESALDYSKPGSDQPLVRDRVVQNFLGQISARRIRNSLVIEVSFTSRDPVKAARIANTIVDVYIERQFEDKKRASEIAIAMIDEKLAGLRDRLAASERRISDFKSANGLIDSKGHGLQDHQLASELESVLAARNVSAQARSRFEQAKRLAATDAVPEAIAEVIQSDTVRQLRAGMTAALRRNAELATRYGPLHPEMRRAEADLAKARSELRSEIVKVMKNLEVEYEVAIDRERQLEARFVELKEQVNAAKSHKWKLHEYERDAKANQDLYEALLSRKKQTEETLGMHFPDSRIVAPADVPLSASHPKRKKILMIAVAAGIVLALGLAILLDQLAGGITNPERIEQEFRLSHLASVPNLQRREDGLGSPLRAVRLMLTHPNGIYADAIREIQYELDWRHHHTGPRIILVTSATPGEGKSLISSNLAHYLALTGRRTLLIDADMRKQTLTNVLDAAGRCGLYEVLCKGQSIEAAILRDDVTGLSFMPAASTRTTGAPPVEILASRRTQTLLGRLKGEYDVILIDAPPLLPVIDARILASQADQILFTMNWYVTPKRSVHRALRSLAQNARKVSGIVLNGTDPAELRARVAYRADDRRAPVPERRLRNAA